MKIAEMFTSVQGESSYAGLPFTFIRTAGCNLRCRFCDTTYAYEGGDERTVDSLVAEAARLGIRRVHLTGGEPLLQPDARGLVKRLSDAGHLVLVETNGSVTIEGVDPRAVVIMDVKTPGSGMDSRMMMENFEFLRPADEVKFVLTDRADYDWARSVADRHGLWTRCGVLMSPAFGMLDPAELAAWILADKIEARLNIQIHKYIFGPDKHGV